MHWVPMTFSNSSRGPSRRCSHLLRSFVAWVCRLRGCQPAEERIPSLLRRLLSLGHCYSAPCWNLMVPAVVVLAPAEHLLLVALRHPNSTCCRLQALIGHLLRLS